MNCNLMGIKQISHTHSCYGWITHYPTGSGAKGAFEMGDRFVVTQPAKNEQQLRSFRPGIRVLDE